MTQLHMSSVVTGLKKPEKRAKKSPFKHGKSRHCILATQEQNKEPCTSTAVWEETRQSGSCLVPSMHTFPLPCSRKLSQL